ncbi:MAG: hypothetical protein OEY44_01520, partial [Candidatus Peregrinibacteria bacterium]|nr:hypothetical protein [Candidatus Peregrinibacteria bacterium]
LNNGGFLMTLAALGFVAYGVLYLYLNFYGDSFELGVATLDGMTKAEFFAANPAAAGYMTHINSAIAGFLISTGIAVAALSWYGVRRAEMWAFVTAVVAPVLALAAAVPLHYLGHFEVNITTHLGPIYLATVIFVIGALIALPAMIAKNK